MMTNNNDNIIYVVIRKDLELTRGKWIAQVVHALLRNVIKEIRARIPTEEFPAIDNHRSSSSFLLQQLEYDDDNVENIPRTIVLYVKSEKALIDLYDTLKEKTDIRTSLQVDAGLNEIERGIPTCLTAGPTNKETIQPYIKRLQTLKD